MIKRVIGSVIISILICINAYGFDDAQTHPEITANAIANSKLSIFLTQYLGLPNGDETQFTKTANTSVMSKSVKEWLKAGSKEEDAPLGRASNHFHNPLKPWDQSYVTDSALQTIYAYLSGWTPLYSNITWATGYKSPTEKASMDDAYNPYLDPPAPNNWDNARIYYYKALTRSAPLGTNGRETAYAQTFQALGQVMHLLEDMAVPAHVRNDFQSHLTFGFSPWYWPYNPFEYFVKHNVDLVSNATATSPEFTNPRLTNFWDTNQYTDVSTNPSNFNNPGLAEYTNANFVSEKSIYSVEEFPYPRVGTLISNPSVTVVSYQIPDPLNPGTTVNRPYFKKVGDGETDYRLAGTDFFRFHRQVYLNDPDMQLFTTKVSPPMDDHVYREYADRLLPRAVGYSAALINYFFRGTIAITLPSSGIYSSATDTAAGFTKITLMAQNTTSGEGMTDGSIELVVKYKLAHEDPFHSYSVETDEEFSYKVVPEVNNVRSIPMNSSVELTFDLSSGNTISFWATDVYLQVVYHGKLGNEDNAVAVGFKDISEPTPVDVFNNMDKVCLNGEWYDAGSQAALDQVPLQDVFPHDLENVYLKISPSGSTDNASPASFTFSVPSIPAGGFYRAYILSDQEMNHSEYATAITADPRDIYTYLLYPGSWPGETIENQVYYNVADQAECEAVGETAPCNIRYYSQFFPFRGKSIWGPAGVIFDNPEYPAGMKCSWELLN